MNLENKHACVQTESYWKNSSCFKLGVKTFLCLSLKINSINRFFGTIFLAKNLTFESDIIAALSTRVEVSKVLVATGKY